VAEVKGTDRFEIQTGGANWILKMGLPKNTGGMKCLARIAGA